MLYRLVRPMHRRTSQNRYFVQRIPADVRSIAVGQSLRIPVGGSFVSKVISPRAVDVRFSLGTFDPAEVKQRQATAAAYLERVWQELRRARDNGPVHLLQDQVIALSGEAYRVFMRAFEREPGDVERWRTFRAEIDEAMRPRVQPEDGEVQPHPERDAAMEARFCRMADELLDAKALVISTSTRKRLLEAIAKAELHACDLLERRAEGDYRDDDRASRFPQWRPPALAAAPASPSPAATANATKATLTAILEDWWKEAKATGHKPSTFESYGNTVKHLIRFLGHDDARKMTPENIVAFKDDRLTSINPKTGRPASPKTVKDSDLAALKTLFGWAVTNRRLASNAAAGLTIKLGKKPRHRPKGFTDGEAVDLLRAADARQRGQERPKTFAAKRWVPWLCAYTGARVGELAQLRKQDLRKDGEHWVIRITPEAGTVKTDEAREVVLHRHLVEKGFPAFVQSCADGHIFLTPAKDGDVLGPLQGVKNRLAEAARTIVTDAQAQPNHGWRHRFKTVAREAGIDSRIVDAIQGHAPRTAGEDYGDVTISAQARVMASFPVQGG